MTRSPDVFVDMYFGRKIFEIVTKPPMILSLKNTISFKFCHLFIWIKYNGLCQTQSQLFLCSDESNQKTWRSHEDKKDPQRSPIIITALESPSTFRICSLKSIQNKLEFHVIGLTTFSQFDLVYFSHRVTVLMIEIEDMGHLNLRPAQTIVLIKTFSRHVQLIPSSEGQGPQLV